eukprot:5082084-Alexandrium_andersonii.AAC.1
MSASLVGSEMCIRDRGSGSLRRTQVLSRTGPAELVGFRWTQEDFGVFGQAHQQHPSVGCCEA